MSFITEFIASQMEDPEQVVADNNRAMRLMNELAAASKERWAQPFKVEGYWKRQHTLDALALERLNTGSDGRQTKYMATATSHANTFDSVMDIYHSIELRMENRNK